MNSIIEMKRNERTNLVLFGAGKSVSVFGTSIYSFAIGLYVLEITGSALNFATTIVMGLIPMLLMSPIAGVVADRMPKKRLVVGMDVANGILFLGLFALTLNGQLSLVVIYGSTILLNVFTTFFGIAIESAKPNLVLPESRLKLNALSKFIDSSASILGPVIGGIVYALMDIQIFIILNGISFLLSAFSEWFIKYDLFTTAVIHTQASEKKRSFLADLVDGGRFFLASKSIFELFLVFVSLNFVLGFSVNVPAPYIINHVLKLTAEAFGLIQAMFPVGLIIGSLTIGRLLNRYSYKGLLIVMNGVIALSASMIGLPMLLTDRLDPIFYILFYSSLHFIMGISIAYVDVPIMTILQEEIPEALRGRVLSLGMSFVKIILPLALILSGVLIKQIHLAVLPAIGGSIALGYSGYLYLKMDSEAKRMIKAKPMSSVEV